jgi:hypothetical protein
MGIASLPFFAREVAFGLFWFVALGALGVATFVCVTLPSSLLLRRSQNPRFRTSLRLSMVSLTMLVLEFGAVVLFHH